MRLLWATVAFLWGFMFGLCVGTANVAHAESAASFLAMCSKDWPCEKSLTAFKGVDTIRVAVLLGPTFNSGCPCLKKLLKDPRPKVVNVKIANGPCLNNRRCGSYEIFAGYSEASARAAINKNEKQLRSRFQMWAARARGLLNQSVGPLRVYWTGTLEHRFKPAEVIKVHNWIRPYFDGLDHVEVNNPQGNNPFGKKKIPGLVQEVHGSKPVLDAPCLADLDGEPMSKIDIPAYATRTRQCSETHLWDEKSNCIDHHIPGFVDPRQRKCKINDVWFLDFNHYLLPGGVERPPLSAVDPRDTALCSGQLQGFGDGAGSRLLKQSDTHPGMVILWPRGQAPDTLKLFKAGQQRANFARSGVFSDGRLMFRTPVNRWQTDTNSVLKFGSRCFLMPYPMFRID